MAPFIGYFAKPSKFDPWPGQFAPYDLLGCSSARGSPWRAAHDWGPKIKQSNEIQIGFPGGIDYHWRAKGKLCAAPFSKDPTKKFVEKIPWQNHMQHPEHVLKYGTESSIRKNCEGKPWRWIFNVHPDTSWLERTLFLHIFLCEKRWGWWRTWSDTPKVDMVAGWWLSLPLWKVWVRQLGCWHSQLNGKSCKIHVPNHQPGRLSDSHYIPTTAHSSKIIEVSAAMPPVHHLTHRVLWHLSYLSSMADWSPSNCRLPSPCCGRIAGDSDHVYSGYWFTMSPFLV